MVVASLATTVAAEPEGDGEAERDMVAVGVLVRRVEHTLTDAQSVPCPTCGQPGIKDDACMHMQCSCGTRYCYVCGRNPGVRITPDSGYATSSTRVGATVKQQH